MCEGNMPKTITAVESRLELKNGMSQSPLNHCSMPPESGHIALSSQQQGQRLVLWRTENFIFFFFEG